MKKRGKKKFFSLPVSILVIFLILILAGLFFINTDSVVYDFVDGIGATISGYVLQEQGEVFEFSDELNEKTFTFVAGSQVRFNFEGYGNYVAKVTRFRRERVSLKVTPRYNRFRFRKIGSLDEADLNRDGISDVEIFYKEANGGEIEITLRKLPGADIIKGEKMSSELKRNKGKNSITKLFRRSKYIYDKDTRRWSFEGFWNSVLPEDNANSNCILEKFFDSEKSSYRMRFLSSRMLNRKCLREYSCVKDKVLYLPRYSSDFKLLFMHELYHLIRDAPYITNQEKFDEEYKAHYLEYLEVRNLEPSEELSNRAKIINELFDSSEETFKSFFENYHYIRMGEVDISEEKLRALEREVRNYFNTCGDQVIFKEVLDFSSLGGSIDEGEFSAFEGEVVGFTFDGITNHSITIDSVSEESVILTIASEPQTVELEGVGDSKQVDLNGDKIPDVKIDLSKINPNKKNPQIKLKGLFGAEIVKGEEVGSLLAKLKGEETMNTLRYMDGKPLYDNLNPGGLSDYAWERFLPDSAQFSKCLKQQLFEALGEDKKIFFTDEEGMGLACPGANHPTGCLAPDGNLYILDNPPDHHLTFFHESYHMVSLKDTKGPYTKKFRFEEEYRAHYAQYLETKRLEEAGVKLGLKAKLTKEMFASDETAKSSLLTRYKHTFSSEDIFACEEFDSNVNKLSCTVDGQLSEDFFQNLRDEATMLLEDCDCNESIDLKWGDDNPTEINQLDSKTLALIKDTGTKPFTYFVSSSGGDVWLDTANTKKEVKTLKPFVSVYTGTFVKPCELITLKVTDDCNKTAETTLTVDCPTNTTIFNFTLTRGGGIPITREWMAENNFYIKFEIFDSSDNRIHRVMLSPLFAYPGVSLDGNTFSLNSSTWPDKGQDLNGYWIDYILEDAGDEEPYTIWTQYPSKVKHAETRQPQDLIEPGNYFDEIAYFKKKGTDWPEAFGHDSYPYEYGSSGFSDYLENFFLYKGETISKNVNVYSSIPYQVTYTIDPKGSKTYYYTEHGIDCHPNSGPPHCNSPFNGYCSPADCEDIPTDYVKTLGKYRVYTDHDLDMHLGTEFEECGTIAACHTNKIASALCNTKASEGWEETHTYEPSINGRLHAFYMEEETPDTFEYQCLDGTYSAQVGYVTVGRVRNPSEDIARFGVRYDF